MGTLFDYDDIPASPPSESTIAGSEDPPPDSDPTSGIDDDAAAAVEDHPQGTRDTLQSTPMTGRRRRSASEAEDLSQHAAWAARRVRLKPEKANELARISQLNPAERSMWQLAMLLKVSERLDDLIPAEAKWTIPSNLKASTTSLPHCCPTQSMNTQDKIELYSFMTLCSPVLSHYVQNEVPKRLLLGILENNARWGYSRDVQQDKYKKDIVASRVGVRLTDRRSDIKEVILFSLGPELQPSSTAATTTTKRNVAKTVPVKLDIVELCAAIIARGPNKEIPLTLQMCTRVAFLRKVMRKVVTTPDAAYKSYWTIVDAQLDHLRKDRDQATVTRILTRCLNEDLTEYGRAALPGGNITVIAAQRLADCAATGTFETADD